MDNSNKKSKTVETYSRKAGFVELKDFDFLAKESGFVEVTKWFNGEGFDVDICSQSVTRFQLTWGEWDALKFVVKHLNKIE